MIQNVTVISQKWHSDAKIGHCCYIVEHCDDRRGHHYETIRHYVETIIVSYVIYKSTVTSQ